MTRLSFNQRKDQKFRAAFFELVLGHICMCTTYNNTIYVDVFSGPRLRKYLRRRARQEDVRPLTDAEIEKIYEAAGKAFPHLSSGSPAS